MSAAHEPSRAHPASEAPGAPAPATTSAPGRERAGVAWVTTAATALLAAGIALGAGVFIGRRSSATPVRAPEVHTDERVVRLPPELARRAGVRAERIVRRELHPALELVGSVDFDADRVADVGGRIPGRITRVHVALGSAVRAGDALVELESAQLGEAWSAYVSARAGVAAARARLARETGLSAQQLTTARALEEARADTARYEAEQRGAEQRLLAMGATPGELHHHPAGAAWHVALRAPIAGSVIRRDVVVGQTIEATSTVMRIADLTRLWVLLDVYERDMGRVRVGDAAEIASEIHPDRRFHGTVSYIDATIDEQTHTGRVRIEVDNTDQLLRVGQFVTARVRMGAGGARSVLAVPRGAVVQLEGRPAVFVARGGDAYEARSLTLGSAEGETVEVQRGLDEGESVVVEGAFALKSEMQR